MSTFLTGLLDILKREVFSPTKKKALKPLVMVLVLWVLEKWLENSKYYNCPKEGYALYGGMFLFGPALCLSALTLLLSNSFWDSATSCLRGRFDRVAICRNTCHALTNSIFVGLICLILTFATTDYFVCFRLGSGPKNAGESIKIQSQSSLLAWFLLIASLLLAFAYSVVEKCFFAYSQESSLSGLRDYERIEAEAAVMMFTKEAKALARREGERQVKAILDEANEGKSPLEVIEKAKKWLITRYSRTRLIMEDNEITGAQLEEVRVESGTHVDEEAMRLINTTI